MEASLASEKTDSVRIELLEQIGKSFLYFSPANNDSASWYFQKALELAKRINDTKSEINVQFYIAQKFYYEANLPQALSITLHYIKRSEDEKDTSDLFYLCRLAGWIYNDMGANETALKYVIKMGLIVRSGFYKDSLYQMHLQTTNASFASTYAALNQLDSALYFQFQVYKWAVAAKDEQFVVLAPYWIANSFSDMGKEDSAFYYYRVAISNASNSIRKDILPASWLGIAALYLKKNQTDSAYYYARQAQTSKKMNKKLIIMASGRMRL